jgi:hypothetical protein
MQNGSRRSEHVAVFADGQAMRIKRICSIDQDMLPDINEEAVANNGAQALDTRSPLRPGMRPGRYVESSGFFERSCVTFLAG